MTFNSMQIVRQLRPDLIHEYSQNRNVFIARMQRLIHDFKGVHHQYVFYRKSYFRDARTEAGRRRLNGKFVEATALKREILAEYADLKRCIRIIDEILFSSGEGTTGQDGRQAPKTTH